MISSKKVLRKWWGFWVVIPWVLLVLVVLLGVASTGRTASEPKTVAEIALYQGPDREKVLIEGAKKEGQLMFYNSNTWFNNEIARAFEKKYPFIKVLASRTDGSKVIMRVMEEFAAGRFLVDVVESDRSAMRILHREGIFQEFFSPELPYYGNEHKEKGKTGVYFWADRESPSACGFNTKLIPPADAPKTLQDLLDPKLKGRMHIRGSSVGIQWVGYILETMGMEYLEKLSRQDVKVQNVSGAAISTLIASGEVPLSPTASISNLILARKKGAPVDWRALGPVPTTVGNSGMTKKAPHPHAALLFLDYLHSKEGQELVMQGDMSSPREDMVPPEQRINKIYPETKYSIEEWEKKNDEWGELMQRLFIRKR